MIKRLNEYTLEDISKMPEINNYKNNDAYDKIMYYLCGEVDKFLTEHQQEYTGKRAYLMIKQFNMFVMTLVYNQKRRLTDLEVKRYATMLYQIEDELESDPMLYELRSVYDMLKDSYYQYCSTNAKDVVPSDHRQR